MQTLNKNVFKCLVSITGFWREKAELLLCLCLFYQSCSCLNTVTITSEMGEHFCLHLVLLSDVIV